MKDIQTYSWPIKRLDHYLTEHYDFSRNFFHHIIERGGITVNDTIVKKSYKLREWDTIVIDDLKRYLDSSMLEDAPKIDIPIVYETANILIINKPKWVLSHPNSVWDMKSPSVVGFLYHNFKELPSIGSFIRAGLIHRLDKETDGLMVVAKTEKWLKHFKELFNQKSNAVSIEEKEQVKLKKFYRARCFTSPKWKEFLQKISSDWLPYYINEVVIPKTPHSVIKMWITKILSFEEEWDEVSFDLEILTGRTHQIRYHLSHHGLTVIWDYVYGKDDGQPMWLTAYKLEFEDEEGEYRSIQLDASS